MAAKLASTQGGARSNGERQEAGPCQSYASVLNPKSASQTIKPSSFKSNNKENIGERVTVSQQQQQPQQQQIQQQQQGTTMVERLMPSMIKDKSCQRMPGRCQATRVIHPVSDNFPEKDKDNRGSLSDGEHPDVAGELNNGDVVNDGEFRTVANKGARRKEKLREQHRENHRERHRLREHNNRHQQQQLQPQQQPRGPIGVGVTRRGSDERSSHRERGDRNNGVAEHGGPKELHHHHHHHHHHHQHHHRDDQNVEVEAQQAPSAPPLQVKYVEAPLPTVNAWTKNRAPATTSQSATNTSPQPPLNNVVPEAATSSTCADRPSDRERRVLQPHQETIGESFLLVLCILFSMVVDGFVERFVEATKLVLRM